MTHPVSGRRFRPFALATAVACLAIPCRAQPKPADPKPPSEEGIPVKSQLVVDKCGGCHSKDEKGNLSRISWERTTPEGWQQAIKRMVRLHGVEMTPEEARSIVRYLSNDHGLAPEEARPVMYIAERRMIDETVAEESVRQACVICHPAGRAQSWRRSKEDWELLINMHVGYFPVVEFQGFRRRPPGPNAPPPAPGTDTRDPAVRVVEYLSKNYPLHTPEWGAWRAAVRPPRLEGRWLISGRQTGRGLVYGETIIEAASQPDEFVTKTRLFFVKDQKTVTTTGRAIIYAGYAWRGRSVAGDGAASPEHLKEAREVMMVSRDQSRIEGRWFWGGYDEFGVDVTMHRAGNDPFVFGVHRAMLKTGSASQQITIYGANLPADLAPGDVDFGPAVTVRRIMAAPRSVGGGIQSAAVEVDVAGSAVTGRRDVFIRRAVATGAFAIYDRIDYLKVEPEAALARLGGNTHPKGYQMFEGVAYHHGPDNKPQTPDDVRLGVVDVDWTIEEFLAVYGDDDKEFVGALSQSGLFTPAAEGPNPKRKFARNNYGDVWVVGTVKPATETGKDGKPVSGRAHLVVTIPLYVRWDQPEVAQ